MKRNLTIVNKLGLHARAAAKFVTTASRFGADITVRAGAQEANGKSIMGIMMLAAGCGAAIEIEALGDDAEDALAALEILIANRFDEAE